MKAIEDEKELSKIETLTRAVKARMQSVELPGCNFRKRGTKRGIAFPCEACDGANAEVCTLLDLVPFVYECVKIGAMLALCLALIIILCVWDVHPHA